MAIIEINTAANPAFVQIPDSGGGGAGTVTSVGLSLPAELTVAGSPVTVSGTLAATWASQSANQVFASPNGAAGTPAFRALVPSDLPTSPYYSVIDVAGTGLVTISNFTTADGNTYARGNAYIFTRTGNVTGIRFYQGITLSRTLTVKMWDVASATLVASGTVATSAIGAYTASFTTPFTIGAGQLYRRYACVVIYNHTSAATAGFSFITAANWNTYFTTQSGLNGFSAVNVKPTWSNYALLGLGALADADSNPITSDASNYLLAEPVFA